MANSELKDKRIVFTTGATRQAAVAGDGDGFPLRYDLLFGNLSLIKRLAETYGEGSLKYAPNNWKQGFPESILVNHAIAHLVQYLGGDRSEDHLAHGVWNLATLMHQQDHKPELMDMTGSVPPATKPQPGTKRQVRASRKTS